MDRTHKFLRDLPRVLPPNKHWTHLWLIYRHVGLSDASRQAARNHWLSLFPEGKVDQIEAYGEAIAAERRAAGEPLPPVPEMLPLVCVIERMAGTDPYTHKCRKAICQDYSAKERFMLQYAIVCIYPNDELFYLMAMDDPMEMCPFHVGLSSQWQRVRDLIFFPFMLWVVALGLRSIAGGVGILAIRTPKAKALWRQHKTGRGKDPFWLWSLSVLLFGGIAALLAPSTLPEYLAVQAGSPLLLFVAAVTATAVGGLLIATARQIVAIYFTAFGIDIETTWADEITGILIGGFVLFHFGNGMLAIALFALADAFPGILAAAFAHARQRKTQPELQPS
jgi:hypothetical protein